MAMPDVMIFCVNQGRGPWIGGFRVARLLWGEGLSVGAGTAQVRRVTHTHILLL